MVDEIALFDMEINRLILSVLCASENDIKQSKECSGLTLERTFFIYNFTYCL